MENLVIYRRYRPQTFKEVVGQAHIVALLQSAIKEGRLAHGYLFIGPRGTGKTSTARILAKALNCKESKEQEPCGKCENCLAIIKGSFLNLIELDAASNRGIDEVRSLKESVRTGFSSEHWKVIILDEAHMLTKEAANALLKMLEEPPQKTLFILVTTEAEKIIPTIKSRLQILPFKHLTLADIVTRLGQIATKEKVEVAENVLKAIALNASGSLRDAESSLAKVLSLGKKQIALDDVRETLGIVDEHLAMRLTGYLAKKDAPQALQFIQMLNEKGIEPKPFLRTFLEYLRKLAFLQVAPAVKNEYAAYLTKEDISIMMKQGGQLTQADTLRLIELFLEALQDIEKYPLSSMSLEVGVMKFVK